MKKTSMLVVTKCGGSETFYGLIELPPTHLKTRGGAVLKKTIL